jgi:hypothetical protein
MLVSVFGTLSLVRAPQSVSALLGASIFAASLGALVSDVALGQFALVCLAAIVATLLLLRSNAWIAASITAALAAMQPNLCLVLIARATGRRAIIALGLGAIIFLVLLLSMAGPAGIAAYLHLLAIHGAAEAATVIQITPAGVALGFGASPSTAESVRWCAAALGLILALMAMMRVSDPTARVGIAACASPFILPFFHEHDFVLLLLPVILCAIHARGSTLAFAAVAATACSVDWLALSQRPNAELQAVILAAAAALGFALLSDLRREAFAGLALPIVVAVVSLVAHQHQIPVWPDGLPLHWQAPSDASVSYVWGLEQLAAGLDAHDPIWSILRFFALVASALVGLATYLTASDVDVHEIVVRRERVGLEAR